MALRAARTLKDAHNISARILDARWLNPLPVEWLAEHAAACGKALILDEGRRSGGVGEAMITGVVEHSVTHVKMRRVVGEDTYIPLGPAAELVLPSEKDVVRAALELCG